MLVLVTLHPLHRKFWFYPTRLTLPAIASLCLTLSNEGAFSREYLSFQAFLQRSACRLEKLLITDWFMLAEDPHRVLGRTASDLLKTTST